MHNTRTFTTICHRILLRNWKFSDKSCREIKIHFT